MDKKQFHAHGLKGKLLDKWHLLDDHLENVAVSAAEFAKSFGGEKWAYIAGLWHDMGKGSKEFQAYLCCTNEVVKGLI